MSSVLCRLVSRVFMVALVSALVARAAVPTGWMLTQTEEGTLTLGVCSPHSAELANALSIEIPIKLDSGSDEPETDTAYTCPFSLSVVLSGSETPPQLYVPVGYTEATVQLPPARAPPVVRAVLTPVSPRAPPLHV